MGPLEVRLGFLLAPAKQLCVPYDHVLRARRRRSVVAVFALLGALLITGARVPAAVASAAPTYLALGDSLAYGMQIGKLKTEIAEHRVSAQSFDTGYVDVLAAKLRDVTPDLAVVDLGCPGETSASFLGGPCAFATSGKPFGTTPLPLHVPYAGSQMDAALHFLATHPEVTTITIDLGINDVRSVELNCANDVDFTRCTNDGWNVARVQTASNLRDIVQRLHAAAPAATLVALGYYDWLAVEAPSTDRLVTDLNATIASATASAGVRFTDPYRAFERTGDLRARLCDLTLYCSPSRDLHPSDAGYRTLADLLAAALQ